MRWPGRFAWPTAALFAVGAELLGLPGTSRAAATADLVCGGAILFGGLAAWRLRAESLIGPLLAAAGLAWFAGTLATADVSLLATIGALTVTLHRGPLVHAALSYPSGRLHGRLERGVVAVAYVYAAVTALGESRLASAAMAGLLLVAAGYRYALAGAAERRRRRANVAAAAVLSTALALVAFPGIADAAGFTSEALLRAYELLLATFALGLCVGLARGLAIDPAVADLVVELGGGSDARILRGRIRGALGDPSFDIGYWLDGTDSYVDERGRPFAPPAASPRCQVTAIERDSRPLAVMVHDPSALADPRLVEGVAAAVRLAVSNVRLQAEIQKQLEDIGASRRRIVAAGDAQRRRLEQAFRQGPERRLASIERALDEARAQARVLGRAPLADALAEVQHELVLAGDELRRFANGIRPAALTDSGLAAALEELVRGAVVPVALTCPPDRLPTAVEAAAYFVCSEGLANLGKHARATRASITVVCAAGRATVSVRDDGVGGADPNAGSGLRGLVDRLEALGGSLQVVSPAGRGTLLVAELPLVP